MKENYNEFDKYWNDHLDDIVYDDLWKVNISPRC